MRQVIFSIVFLLFCSISFSQIGHDSVPHYESLKEYKEKHQKSSDKNEALNLTFVANDTLVLLGYHPKQKGTMVPYEPKDSTFLYYYKKVAFNHKNDSISKNTSMKYWKDDIRIFFSESVSRKTKKNLMSFVKIIDQAVDSLKISEVKNLEESNFVIYYFGDHEYEPRMRNYKYSDYYACWEHNKFYMSSIKLDPDVYFGEDLKQYKLREYFLLSLGYFKQIDDLNCESYFSNCYSPDKRLTQLDIELLKYHYSYGICKGQSLETFEEQHKQAQEVYEKTGHQMRFFHPFEEDVEN